MTRRLGSSVSVLTAAALVVTPMLAATLSGCSKSGRSNRGGAIATATTSGSSQTASGSTATTGTTTGGGLTASSPSTSTAPTSPPSSPPSTTTTSSPSTTTGSPTTTTTSTPTSAPGTPTSTPTTTTSAPTTPTSAPSTTTTSTAPAPAAVDADPPVITITSPARASYSTVPQIVIAGNVTDAGSGVAAVAINGTPIPVDANGDFAVQATAGRGLNIIQVTAQDGAGNGAQTNTSILAGNFLAPNQPVAEALTARVEESAFLKLQPVINATLVQSKPQINAGLAALNPVLQRTILFVDARADITGVDFSSADVRLDPVQGGLAFSATLNDLDVDIQAQIRALVRISVSGELTADAISVSGVAAFGADPQTGRLVFAVQNVNVTTQGFAFDINNIPDFVESLLRGTVRNLVEGQIRDRIVNQIPATVNTALGGLGAPIQRTILGRDFALGFAPTGLAFDDAGVTLALAANVAASQPTARGQAAPGSLTTPGAAPIPFNAGGADFLAAINDDLVNKALFAAWGSGLLDLEVDPTQAFSALISRITGSSALGGITFNSSLLLSIFPQLQGAIPAGAPIVLRAEPRLPPVVRIVPNATPASMPAAGTVPDVTAEVSLGELVLSLAVADPSTGNRIPIFEIATQVRARAGLTVDAQGNMLVSLAGTPDLAADVISELIDLPDSAIQALFGQALPLVINLVANGHGGIPLPQPAGLPVSDLQVGPAGQSGDFLAIAGNIRTR